MSIHIRLAISPEDTAAVARLRYVTLVEEKGMHLEGTNHAARSVVDTLDAVSDVFAAFDGDTVVGTARVTSVAHLGADHPHRSSFQTQMFPMVDAEMSVVTRFVIHADYRRTMVFRRLLDAVVAQLVSTGCRVVLLESGPRTAALYEALGCRQYRDPIADPAWGLVIPMFVQIETLVHGHLRATADKPGYGALGEALAERFPLCQRIGSLRLMAAPERTRLEARITVCGGQLFSRLNMTEVQRVLRNAIVVDFARKSEVFLADGAATELLLVLDGTVALSDFRGHACTRLGPGEVFGERGFLGGIQSSASVGARVLGPARLLAMDAEVLEQLSAAAQSDVAARFLRGLAGALAERLVQNPRSVRSDALALAD